MLQKLFYVLAALFSITSYAFEYEIKCDGENHLTGYSVQNGFYDGAQSTFEQSDSILLRDPFDSYYSNRMGRYKISRIREVVGYAIANGFDPYTALAVVSIENPMLGTEKTEAYRGSWGNPPIDGSGLASSVGCMRVKDQNTSGISNRNNERVNVVISEIGRRELLKIGDVRTATFGEVKNEDERGCYFWASGLRADWKAMPSPETQENERLYQSEILSIRSHLGARYMALKFNFVHSLIANGKGVWIATPTWKEFGSSPFYKMSMIAQGFNGHGTYGITEGANSCLEGIKTNENPIYGAGVMHLALNVFLANATIRDIVKSELESRNYSYASSEFCRTWNFGTHRIDPKGFVEIQKRIIQPRESTGCAKTIHTYDYKPISIGSSIKSTLREN